MKFLLLVLAVSFVIGEEELPLAKPCDKELCKPPNCRCSSSEIPGGLAARDTPQFVTLTFDDAINPRNIETYREILYNRRNSNGCPSGFTFYINHEYNDYQMVNELYNQGFEIALHSMTHRNPQTFWANASYEDMVKEFSDQRTQMAYFANIPQEEIKGMRIPFLQLGGNSSYQMMAEHNVLYDSSWTTIAQTDPGLWPYTLDYASTQDCPSQFCPTASLPGVWVQPLVSWTDLQGFPCAMVDACYAFPDRTDEDAWFRFILANFERHYLNNRAPFGFYTHESYLDSYPAVKRAVVKFLNLVNSLHDVFLVNSHEVIDWVRNPVPIDEYRQQPCRSFTRTTCLIAGCGPYVAEHNFISYWLPICTVCPRVYPWIGNPLGR